MAAAASPGVIGLELGTVWRRLGAKVTVIEYLDHIMPGMDKEIIKESQKIFAKQGIEFKMIELTFTRRFFKYISYCNISK